MKIALLIPTYNAGSMWAEVLHSIATQACILDRKIVIDSASTDQTVDLAKQHGFEVINLDKKDFDHGYARQLLAESALDCEILIYLTQDCILKDSFSLSNLIKAFDEPKTGLAYGRQLPHKGAKILESHARLFNYPAQSIVKRISDKEKLGIKTASCSNSFAAYRLTALQQVGGFPSNTILGEDVIVAGRMLIKGWSISYVGNAESYHSHDYTAVEEFKRYFDIGVFHKTDHWLIDEFGTAGGEGFKYLKSELAYVLKKDPFVLPKMVGTIAAKFLGYKLGMMHEKLSHNLKKKISMHHKYWDKVK